MSNFKGIVTNAELCTPIDQVEIIRLDPSDVVKETVFSNERGEWRLSNFDANDTVLFSKDGFGRKTYRSGTLPDVVRLLEDRLIGYQERLWFLPGEDVTVFAHSPVAFSATLYRHGLNKEAVLELGCYGPCCQSVPDGYFVASGLAWEKTFGYKIPVDAMPGIYSLMLKAENQESFAIPFVVSTPKEKYGDRSKLLVLASTNTWQSYNMWGGRSRYRNFEDGNSPDFFAVDKSVKQRIKGLVREYVPSQWTQQLKTILGRNQLEHWRFKKLSIWRPFTNCALEDETPFQPYCNHLAAGEWRLLAWLEREKIPYDIVSGYELHIQSELLQNYRAIIFSTHCEYWSREMYEGLKYYHEHKNLYILNLSGNTLFRLIEFFEDGSTRCVSLSFHATYADETQILGVRFSESDYGTCAPYKITLPDHWAFEGVPFHESGRMFGTRSLNQNVPKNHTRYDAGRPGLKKGLKGMGASGWETDKISETAPADIKVIAKGMNRGGGADMVVREPSKSRGGMFSASSVCFTGCLLIDKGASKVVLNVISRALNNT